VLDAFVKNSSSKTEHGVLVSPITRMRRAGPATHKDTLKQPIDRHGSGLATFALGFTLGNLGEEGDPTEPVEMPGRAPR
jgi:hypothetical protein